MLKRNRNELSPDPGAQQLKKKPKQSNVNIAGFSNGQHFNEEASHNLVKILTENLIQKIFEQNRGNHYDIFICSINTCCEEKALKFLKESINPNMKDEKGRSILYLAVKNGHSEAVIKELLNKKANPNIANLKGETALIAAAVLKRTNIIKMLLSYEADPNLQDDNGTTGLMEVCKSMRLTRADDYNGMFKALLEKNSNPNLKDSLGKTALHHLSEMNYMHQSKSMLIRSLIEHGADVNSQAKDLSTPLMKALRTKDKRSISLLLNDKTDLNLTDKNGNTAFMRFISLGGNYTDFIDRFLDLSDTPKVNLDKKNIQGETVLYHLARSGFLPLSDIIKLIDIGASMIDIDSHGRSLHDVANQEMRTKLLKKCEQYRNAFPNTNLPIQASYHNSSYSSFHERDTSSTPLDSNHSTLPIDKIASEQPKEASEFVFDFQESELPSSLDLDSEIEAFLGAETPTPSSSSRKTSPTLQPPELLASDASEIAQGDSDIPKELPPPH